MTTGTTGDDVLTNDVNVANEVVDALGGNDTITVNRPNPSAAGSYSARSVTVNGDAGFDTLILQASQLISLNGTGLDRTAMLREGGAGAWTLNFTSVERLEITAGLYGNAPTVITGDSVDIFRFHASIGANNSRIETGGGDDDVRLSGANFTGTTRIDAGSGNDVIDLRPILSNPFLIVADGGEGNDIIYGSLVADDLKGGAGNDILDGGAGDDFLRLQDGGDDIASGGAGNDVFLFGAALASGDQVTGGVGIDQIVVQGNYAGPQALVLGANVASIENLATLAGSDTRFGDPGTNFYDYEISVLNEAVAAGIQLVVDASPLRLGEDLTFNGSAEADGSFFIYGGGGDDHLTGGAKNDVFIFGHQGQWGSGDVVNGGPGGIDQLGLRGNYTIVFGAGQLIGIEQIGMVSAQDTRYGPLGSSYSYDLTMVDANVDSIQMTVDAAPLRPNETLTFNGSAEDDGSFRIFGGRGADVIGGSQNADILVGRDGADMLTGNGGNDLFRYDNTGESVSGARDKILDFGAGDLVDLSRIDADVSTAGNQAFNFIGDTAFGNVAGQLRYQSNGGTEWLIQGDTDGNGSADFELILNIPVAHPITSADFIL